jgi:3-oxoacyl-[acyl-carrier-protein] synthase II
VTPLGCTTQSTWLALVSSGSSSPAGATGATLFNPKSSANMLPIVVMRVPHDELPSAPPPLLGRNVPSVVHYALLCASAALTDAGLPARFSDADAPLAGTAIGVGMAHVPDLVQTANALASGKPRLVSPFLVSRVLINTPAGLIAQTHNLQGPNSAPGTACAAGAHAVADGFHAILRGEADVMVVGGTEAAIEDVGLAGFSRARALSTGFVDCPTAASRPFDARRDGFVMGEGAGVLILEDAEHARRRGVKTVYAELAGAGASGDAWHATSPPPDGRGAQAAMRAALRSAGMEAASVDYINAHATGTPVGDAVERRAIAAVFPSCNAIVSSTKGAMGHLLGAAGAVEAGIAALAVSNGIIPGTRNLKAIENDAKCKAAGWGDLERYTPGDAVHRIVNGAMSNSFGFGGTNASLLMRSPPCGFARRVVRMENKQVQ